ncbi:MULTISPECIES: COG4705 family protein [Bifidobacterium]|jgi:uncharacterized membrane-anchored protein|uniref:Membrane-anchored protein n=1 Tax=Bifidobacterium tibiigranuli TaxID=2172043 RepID=A0A5N6S8K0_9BIFI|nr:hypothetical protein [Bifidobacterium tibiigranuli]KAE8129256.1 hypothetical protein DDE84_04100 [Bifidobacterium tibiigranuli]KAE8129494.1 hypothetical protein DDF78_03890 [Bifidobacterium tibiigranuli]MCI1210471.1 hypothetical protein [Bifidobacterium tibiigranuli]MCI1221057.1 hypothetical protein [Bifidobacterium tibiigranuli]MCI1231878.1 hypothetical protein [Bifidobacterium tibiigranuli]
MNIEHAAHQPNHYASAKVPRLIAAFWIVKLLTTAFGEAFSDYSVVAVDPHIAVIGAGIVLIVALVIQLRMPCYNALAYWFAVTMVAVFGTMAADVLHVQFGVPYEASTGGFAIALAIVFIVWHKVEGTLNIHSITTPRREIFYWLAVMAAFALGTAASDMVATTFHLGYIGSLVLFAVLITVPTAVLALCKANTVLLFWYAYVLTRPVGASAADFLGKPKTAGGMGFGDGPVALILGIVMAIAVGYLAVSRVDRQEAN